MRLGQDPCISAAAEGPDGGSRDRSAGTGGDPRSGRAPTGSGGALYAVPAAITVQNARAMTQAQPLTEQLRAALGQRVVTDQAVGILMSRSGTSNDEALERVGTFSQQ